MSSLKNKNFKTEAEAEENVLSSTAASKTAISYLNYDSGKLTTVKVPEGMKFISIVKTNTIASTKEGVTINFSSKYETGKPSKITDYSDTLSTGQVTVNSGKAFEYREKGLANSVWTVAVQNAKIPSSPLGEGKSKVYEVRKVSDGKTADITGKDLIELPLADSDFVLQAGDRWGILF